MSAEDLAEAITEAVESGLRGEELCTEIKAAFDRYTSRLKESEERYRALVEASIEGLVVSVDGRIVECNQAFADLTGWPREELIGRPVVELTRDPEVVMRRILSGDTRPYVVRAVRKDGTETPVELLGRTSTYRGRPARVTAVRDVSDRLRAEAQLRDSERRFRELADMLPVAVAESDLQGKITFINREGVAAAGFASREEAMGVSVIELVDPKDAERASKNFASRFAGGPSEPQPYMMRRRDGSTYPGAIHAAPIERDGKLVGLRAAMVDLTHEKRAEEARRALEARVQRAEKLESLGILAGGVAHDFNNLLMAMLGNADLALVNATEESNVKGPLKQIKRAARRASDLTQHLLAYAGRGRFAVEATDVNALVREMAELLSVSFPKGVVVKLELAAEPLRAMADAAQLRQVIMNLLANAADAIGDKGGTITAHTSEVMVLRADQETWQGEELTPGRYISLVVTDTGAGMDKETIAKIFDPFFTTKPAGRGLGLAAVIGIVRGHRGAIRVESKRGEGSLFEVLLPPAEATEAPAGLERMSGPIPRDGFGTVLVVDDEADVVDVAAAMISNLGYKVLRASDGLEAVEQVRAHRNVVRLVLLDLRMPRMNGIEALARIRELAPGLPVVLTTGFEEDPESLAAARPSGFLRKPYALAELRDALRHALES